MGRRKTVSDSELLAAAREEFIAHGAGATTRAIARRAGISEAVIYQRYATKHELFFAAMVPPAAPDMLAMLENPDAPVRDLAQLQQVAACALDYFRQLVPVLLPVLTQSEFSFEEFARRHPNSPLEQLRGQMFAFFSGPPTPAAQPPGLPQQTGVVPRPHAAGTGHPPADPRTRAAALAFVATLQGLALFEQLGAHGGRISEEEVREIVRVLWSGAGSAQ